MDTKKTLTLAGAVLAAVFWQSGVARSQVARDGLLSYWTFDASHIVGGTALDAWGDRDGTIVGDTRLVAGRIVDALYFDGDSDYVEFDDTGLPQASAPRTMSVWVNPEGAGVRSALEWGTNAAGQRCGILVLENQAIKFVGQNADVTSRGTVANGEWHHVIETYDGTNIRIYIDGVLDVEQAVSINTVLNVGRIGANIRGDEFFHGSIDEACIYGRALTDAEVAQNFSARQGLFPDNATPVKPKDNARDVARDGTVLIWEPGESAVSHDVYFGMSWSDVDNATPESPQFLGNQTETMYTLDRLELGQTYYWRIDEVNEGNPNSPWKGDVWSFTAEPIGYPLVPERIVATASSAKNDEEGPENAIDGSGLNADDAHSITVADMWRTASGDEDPWVEFAFDKSYLLHEMLLWNHNSALEPVVGFGIREATVEYSLDGTEWISLGMVEFNRATGRNTYGANTTIAFEGAAARYVRIVPISNWGGVLPQYGLSEVRFLYIPVFASQPDPTANTGGLPVELALTWRSGRQAATHQVYLSDDEAAVVEGTVPVVQVTEPSYQPDPLHLGRTYYWRVDEVNEVEDPSVWQGDVWNFTVRDVIVVEDFEAYTDDMEAGKAIFQTWIDGAENGTGSFVGYEQSNKGTFGEVVIVHGGRQAMPLFYDNTTGAAESVTTRTFAQAHDWTQSGIQGLVVYFQGSTKNTGGQLYVEINDTKVPYDGDPENLTRAAWSKWYIELNKLDPADLQKVTSLSIGIDSGGQGVVYLDDITLTPYGRQLVTPTEPAATDLVVHYAFDGDAADSTGQYPGKLVGGPVFGPGAVGQAIWFDGVGSYLQMSGFKGILGSDPVTVSAWINTTTTISGSIVSWGRTGSGRLFDMRTEQNRLRFEHGGGYVQADAVINDGTWHHVAVTIQANATISYPEVTLWVDGMDNTRPSTDPDPFNLIAGEDGRIGSRSANDDRFFVGQIDEVRIYDRALSAGEMAWLAGRTVPFDQ